MRANRRCGLTHFIGRCVANSTHFAIYVSNGGVDSQVGDRQVNRTNAFNGDRCNFREFIPVRSGRDGHFVVLVFRPSVFFGGERLFSTGSAPANDRLGRRRLTARVERFRFLSIYRFRFGVKDRVPCLCCVANVVEDGLLYLRQLARRAYTGRRRRARGLLRHSSLVFVCSLRE